MARKQKGQRGGVVDNQEDNANLMARTQSTTSRQADEVQVCNYKSTPEALPRNKNRRMDGSVVTNKRVKQTSKINIDNVWHLFQSILNKSEQPTSRVQCRLSLQSRPEEPCHKTYEISSPYTRHTLLGHIRSHHNKLDEKNILSFKGEHIDLDAPTPAYVKKLQALPRKPLSHPVESTSQASSRPLPVTIDNLYHLKLPSPKATITSFEALQVLLMYHRKLLDFVIDPKLLDKSLAEMAKTAEAISEGELLLTSKGKFELKAVARRCDTYIMFTWPESIHLLGILDRVVYIGKSLEEPERTGSHMAKARKVFVSLPEENEKRSDQAIDQFLAYCWHHQIPHCNHRLIAYQHASENVSFFTEYCAISAIRNLPYCQNRNHGSLRTWTAALPSEQVPLEDKLAEFGLATITQFCKSISSPQALNLFCEYSRGFGRDHEKLLNAMAARLEASQSNGSMFSSAKSCLEAKIPSFSLLDDDQAASQPEALLNYAVHLATSLWTIAPKAMRWFIYNSDAQTSLEAFGLFERAEVMELIASVTQYRPDSLIDCIDWALWIYKTVFEENVALANELRTEAQAKLTEISLGDAADMKLATVANEFITAAALLQVRLYAIRDNEGNVPTEESVNKSLADRLSNSNYTSKYQNGLYPRVPYRKPTKFNELSQVCRRVHLGIHWKGPHELYPQMRSLRPLDIVDDDELLRTFLASTMVLRRAIYIESVNITDEIKQQLKRSAKYRSIRCDQPFFPWSHLFPQFI